MEKLSVQNARMLLAYSDKDLDVDNIRKAFFKSVRNGHSDKGGCADIGKLIAARDVLITQASWQSLRCSVGHCMEAPEAKKEKCAFHANYS